MRKLTTTLLCSNSLVKTCFHSFIFALLLSACSNKTINHQIPTDQEYQDWFTSIVNYRKTLDNHKTDNSKEPLFQISEEMRLSVRQNFSHLSKRKAMKEMVKWLIDADKHAMQYNLNANFPPIEAFERKQANCLSFTILLVNLAKEIDIELQYNDVHLPDIWGLDSENGPFTLFRHVNAIRKTINSTQIFDLAIEDYDYGYPQQVISESHAIAQLYSNIAIDYMKDNNEEKALHHMKYALSLYSSSADFWVNLGVVYKRMSQLKNSERALVYALTLDRHHFLAASNLQRLYELQGLSEKASYYEKLATKARNKNPYLHYVTAKKQLESKRYKSALKSIAKAKKLHDSDPRFYVLSSIIHQQSHDFIQAIKDLQKAQTLTVDNKERQAYIDKARLLVPKLQNQQNESQSGLKYEQRF